MANETLTDRKLARALARYRIIAYLVGVLLVLLTIGMGFKYLADQPVLVAMVSPVHGFAFIVYLVATFALARQLRWPLRTMLLVMLAGTVPLLSFYAERWATRDATARLQSS